MDKNKGRVGSTQIKQTIKKGEKNSKGVREREIESIWAKRLELQCSKEKGLTRIRLLVEGICYAQKGRGKITAS